MLDRGTRILVVERDPTTLALLCEWLYDRGFIPLSAATPSEAVRAAQSGCPALAVIDQGVCGTDEGTALGALLKQRFRIDFILTGTGIPTLQTVSAMLAGARDVIDKPLEHDLLVSSVNRALRVQVGVPFWRDKGEDRGVAGVLDLAPAGRRWSRMVLEVRHFVDDPRTVPIWARAIGAGTGTIEETCRLCGVRAHSSKALARFLRAIWRNRSSGSAVTNEFAVADERTLRHLFERAGLSCTAKAMPVTAFLDRQTFVSTSAPCLIVLRELASAIGFV